MSTAVLTQKLTFDEARLAAHHRRIAIGYREAARRYPASAPTLRAKMRAHALSLRAIRPRAL